MMRNYHVFLLLVLSSSVESLRLTPLLSTCIDACQRGCQEIRTVYGQGALSNVELKDESDPRSVLTEADQAAQRVIVQSLRTEWGDQKLNIVGEEDEEDDDTSISVSSLDRTLLNDGEDYDNDEVDIDPSDITIFVDPLDGTREFVEGRLENVQCLVGIAIDGEAVAGAIGIPFPSGKGDDNMENEPPSIVYGISGVGAGVLGTPLKRGPIPLEQHRNDPRPHFATGDSTAPVMKACKKALLWEHGGSSVLYGGAGNKLLAVALGTVKCAFSHKVGGPWDLCAPQAIVQAMGGTMTDLFGEPIKIYEDPSCGVRGFLATPPGEEYFHEKVVTAFRKTEEVAQYQKDVCASL